MSLNSLKKMIIFSSDKTKNLIEKCVNDEAQQMNRSASSIIEKNLLSAYLPQNKTAKLCVEIMYAENDSQKGIGTALGLVFANSSIIVDDMNILLPFVEYLHQKICLSYMCHDGAAPGFKSLMKKIDWLAKEFDILLDNTEDPFLKIDYRKTADYIRELVEDGKAEPFSMKFLNITNTILKYWSVTKDWAITFTVLKEIAFIENIEEIPNNRVELLALLKDNSILWKS